MYRARMDSQFGPLLLCGTQEGLSGLYFVDQKDCPPLPDGPGVRPDSLRPSSGESNGIALKTLRPRRVDALATNAPAQTSLFAASSQSGAYAVALGGDMEASLDCDVATLDEGIEFLDDAPEAVIGLFSDVREQLDQYFEGSRQSFDIPLALSGTVFQRTVWQALCQVPYGQLVSYGELAAKAGLSAGHGRPVGTAVGRNPIAIVVPCHRIVGASGMLTGYTGGLSRKVELLEIEGHRF